MEMEGKRIGHFSNDFLFRVTSFSHVFIWLQLSIKAIYQSVAKKVSWIMLLSSKIKTAFRKISIKNKFLGNKIAFLVH